MSSFNPPPLKVALFSGTYPVQSSNCVSLGKRDSECGHVRGPKLTFPSLLQLCIFNLFGPLRCSGSSCSVAACVSMQDIEVDDVLVCQTPTIEGGVVLI